MKIIKIIIISVLIIFAVVLGGIFVAYKTINIDTFREQIADKISESMGADISMENLGWSISLENGISLDIKGLNIYEKFTQKKSAVISIEEVILNADIISFVKNRTIMFSKVSVLSPTLTVIKKKDGNLNVSSLAASPEGEHSLSSEKGSASSTSSAGKKEPAELLISSVSLEKGTIFYKDESLATPRHISIDDIYFQVTNLAFDKSFVFKLSAAVLSEKTNLSTKGKAIISPNNQQIRVDDWEGSLNLSTLDFMAIKSIVPDLNEWIETQQLKGQLKFNFAQIIAGASGLEVLSLNTEITDMALNLKNPQIELENIDIKAEITETDINISEIFANLGTGIIRGKSQISEYTKEKDFSLNLNWESLDINDLKGKEEFPVEMEGKIFGNVDVKGNFANIDKWQESLMGESFVALKDGKLIDINVLKMVLDKISFIPNLAQNVYEGLSDKYKKKLEEKDTLINQFEVDSRIRDASIYLNAVEVESNEFLFVANGKMDFNGNIHLNRSLLSIPADISKSMVKSTAELQYFLNDKEQIVIPFKAYSGALSEILIYPDIEDIGKTILRNRGKQELKNVLFKALDLEDKSQETVGENAPLQEGEPAKQPVSEKKSEEVLIENVLDGFLNKVLK